MKARELMDKEFVYLNCEDSVVEVSKVMEEIRRFTCPVVNDNKQLVGWITSFDITRGLREGNEKIIEIMSSYEEITTIIHYTIDYYLFGNSIGSCKHSTKRPCKNYSKP